MWATGLARTRNARVAATMTTSRARLVRRKVAILSQTPGSAVFTSHTDFEDALTQSTSLPTFGSAVRIGARRFCHGGRHACAKELPTVEPLSRRALGPADWLRREPGSQEPRSTS